MYTVVTGAAGFIGANLVRRSTRAAIADIIAVDNLAHADKFTNLVDCEIADYLDKEEFLLRLADGDFDDDIGAILHQGACSDTMETDGRYMMRNNFRYSVALVDWCQDNDVPFLYASSASVYGGGSVFREERAHEAPLNIYGYSKFLFDQYVRRLLPDRTAQIAGFRYFNVYGPRERHKGRMASVVLHFFDQYRAEGSVRLFEGVGRLRRRRAAARFRVGRRRRQGQSRFSRPSRSAAASSISAAARGDVQRGRGRDDQCVPRDRRQAAPTLAELVAEGASATSRFRRRSSASTRASPRPISRGCAAPATRRRCKASPKAFRATSNG